MQEFLGTDKQVNKTDPVVSVCVVTYNHKHFIEQCIDGILNQKTNFPFELIIGEDDSKDGTRELCINYAEKYPDKIRLFLRNEKDKIWISGSKTGRFNFIENLKAAKGKYIALCEGDDYWTDSLKLQKQVDSLNGNEEIIGSYTDTYVKTEDYEELKYWREPLQPTMTLNDVIDKKSPFHTSSFLFRNKHLEKLPDWLNLVPSGDMFLFAYMALYGKLIKANTSPTVYRKHEGGVTNSSIHNNQGFHIGRLFLWTKFKKEYNIELPKIDEVIRFHASSLLNSNMSISDINLVLKKIGFTQTISIFGGRSLLKSTIKRILTK